MGLLDAFNSDEGLMGMGLLMAAAPSPQNIGIGARLGTALNWVQGQKDSRQDREAQAMRMDAIRQQQAQAQQAQQRDQQFAQALQGGANPAELARYFPDKVDLLKKLADAPNFGRQAVARTIDVELPGGGKGVRQLDQFGAPVTDDMPGYVAPQGVNLGDKYVFTKPVAGQSLQMGMSPSERDASARGWASNSMARERLEMDKQGGEGGKPVWNSELGGFVDPRTRVVMPALNADGTPIQGSKGKLTESESKSTLYLSQMRDATKVLNELGDGVSPAMVAATGSPYTNWIAGETPQKAGQAQRQWAEAYLREKTGAAATAGEVENNIRTFFPVIGDSEKVIQQKRNARAEAERAMEIPAGRGVARLPDVPKPKANVSSIPPKAIAELKMRGPSAKAQFDSAFGVGAADAVLGGSDGR